MNEKQKEQIREALRLYVMKYPSQNKAAASLDGTSAGTVSSVLSGKWENISDDMWRKIASQVGCRHPWCLADGGDHGSKGDGLCDD